MSRRFNRRVLLRGLGGAAVAAPFLSSVAERTAKTQGLPPPAAPKRLIVLLHALRLPDESMVPREVPRAAQQERLPGDVDARAHGAVRGQAADGARHPRHERVELRRGPRADERSPHAGLWIVLQLPSRDPQRDDQPAQTTSGSSTPNRPVERSITSVPSRSTRAAALRSSSRLAASAAARATPSR